MDRIEPTPPRTDGAPPPPTPRLTRAQDAAEWLRPTCRAAVFDILFEGRAPSEGRLEALLDRMEGAR